MSHAWRYRVVFDGPGARDLLSSDVRVDPGWGHITAIRLIKSVEFFLPIGLSILLAGMHSYNFFSEVVEAMRGARPASQSFWLLGRRPGSRVVDRWHVIAGRVESSQVFFGHEWMGSSVSGWKPGSTGNPVSMLRRI